MPAVTTPTCMNQKIVGDECRRLRGEGVVDTDHRVAAASADLEVVCELVLAPRDPRAPMNPDDGRERSTGTWRVGVEASVGVGRSVLLVADGGDTGRDVTEGAQLRSLLANRSRQRLPRTCQCCSDAKADRDKKQHRDHPTARASQGEPTGLI